MPRTIGLQLWSLREEFSLDPKDTLYRVPQLGFGAIETAGDYGWSNDQWNHILGVLRLRVYGCHIGLEHLTRQLEKVLAFAEACEAGFIVVPSLSPGMRTREGYQEAARHLNELAPRLAEEQLRLLYHNHAFEFEPLEAGGTGMEILLAETDPDTVSFEVDTSWVEHGGLNSLDFISQNQARIAALHLKDYDKSTGADTAVGSGSIEFPPILELAARRGWPLIVEYEGPDPAEALEASSAYLREHAR